MVLYGQMCTNIPTGVCRGLLCFRAGRRREGGVWISYPTGGGCSTGKHLRKKSSSTPSTSPSCFMALPLRMALLREAEGRMGHTLCCFSFPFLGQSGECTVNAAPLWIFEAEIQESLKITALRRGLKAYFMAAKQYPELLILALYRICLELYIIMVSAYCPS